MSVNLDNRKSEISNILEDYFRDLVLEVSPYVSREDAKKLGKSWATDATAALIGQVDNVIEEAEKEISDLEKEFKELQERSDNLRDDNHDLEKECAALIQRIEELQERIDNPTSYFSKKLGI